MAATVGTIFRVTIDVLSDGTGPAVLVLLEKEGYVCDSADAPHVKVVKEIDVTGRGEHLGQPFRGDQYTVTFASPVATHYIDEAADSVAVVVTKAGEQAHSYESRYVGGGWPYYD